MMADDEPCSDEPRQPRPKRQKIQVACMRCRAKKIKCDGRRPVCGPCDKRYGEQAVCNLRPTPNEELDAFRNRIAQLDERVRELQDRDSHASPRDMNASRDKGSPAQASEHVSYPQQRSDSASNAVNIGSNTTSGQLRASSLDGYQSAAVSNASRILPKTPTMNWPQGWQSGPERRSEEEQLETQAQARDEDEGVDAMVGAISDDGPDQAFFGPSSAGRFVQQIRSVMNNSTSVQREFASSGGLQRNSFPQTSNTVNDRSLHFSPPLPPKPSADHLIQIYWRIVYPLYPFLDRNEAQKLYADVWREPNSRENYASFLCQLNVIFALSCQLNEDVDPSQRAASATEYIRRAKRTLDQNLWQGATITAIQTFLILAQYLQSTNNAYQCWIVVGHAIRMAQSLGLHLRDTTERIGSPRRRQLQRKVWHGCILMDRVVSMTYGRPAMIEENAAASVPRPLAIDDEYLTDNPEQRTSRLLNRPMLADFYIQTLKLYEILNKVLIAVYTVDNSVDDESDDSDDEVFGLFPKAEGQASLLQLDHSLTIWHKKLPSHLRIQGDDPGNQVFHRQARILNSRYLHVRILLYRPIMSRFIAVQNSSQPQSSPTETTLSWQLAFRCSLLCVESAQKAIEAISGSLPATTALTGSLPSWWYNVLYVYTAATILLAALLCTTITAEIPQQKILRSWRTAIRILRQYRSFSPSVRKSIAALEILFQRLPTHETQGCSRVEGNLSNLSDPRLRNPQYAAGCSSSQQELPNSGLQQLERQPISSVEDMSMNTDMNETMNFGGSDHLSTDDNFTFAFDPYDLNMSFDITDLSWLNTLPYSF